MSKWEETILSECISVSSGEGLSERKMKPGPYLVYGGNGFAGLHDNYLYEQEKLIIGRVGAHCGNVHITKSKSWVTDNALIVSFLNNEDDLRFWFYLLSNSNLRAHAFESAQPVITGGIISKIKVAIPSPKTQRQIATILSTADAVIEKTQAAIAKYKAIKQGMLQDLFTRGLVSEKVKGKSEKGEEEKTIWKLRPSYQDAPELYKESKLGWIPKEWEDNQLSSVVEVINGGTPSTQIKEYWNGEIPWLSVDDFNNSERFVSTAYKKITQEGLKNSSTNILMPDMVIISARGTVGVISQLKIPMAFNQSCYGLNSINTNLQNDYLYYFLIYYKQYFGFTTYGSVFGTITRNYFDTMYIPMNLNSDEQKIIVGRLGIIDKKLQTEQDFLHKQQQIKAGLMGDLLSGRKKVIYKQTITANE